jgi:hypothetical protein
MIDSTSNSALNFSPLVPWEWIVVMAAVAALLLGYALLRRSTGAGVRSLLCACLLFIMSNPTLVTEDRNTLSDIIFLMVDESTSQTITNRSVQAGKSTREIEKRLSALPNTEVQKVIIRSQPFSKNEAANKDGTPGYQAWQDARKTIAANRYGGAVFVTDGQLHDLPIGDRFLPNDETPLHFVITGAKDETDRVLTVLDPPSFGIVNKSVKIRYKVDDHGTPKAKRGIVVTTELDGEIINRTAVLPGRTQEMDLILPHGGINHIILRAETLKSELSARNNMAVLAVNGVRDRLKVLLVSGEPHMGERGWRNILKSDPSVDLVHFTILRPPEKQDGTPLNELSLIPFPIVELFERKLDEFDLIIFDRYRKRGVLNSRYLNNIVDYVNGGGALLEAAGPSFATSLSLYRTPLAILLPGRPTGTVFETPYRPALSEDGKKHPVTANLPVHQPDGKWGRWFRMIDADLKTGTVVMTGPTERPLLILSRQGKGRVAQLMSDHAWLWGRGFEGGGPQAELFRRTAHWLMKEPELEEEQLSAIIAGDRLKITRRSLTAKDNLVTIQNPDNSIQKVQLTERKGHWSATADIDDIGLYELTNGPLRTMIAVGNLNPLEERDIRATDEKIAPFAKATSGRVLWAVDEAIPSFRKSKNPARMSSASLWGIKANQAYDITGIKILSLIPPFAALFLLVGGLCLMWWRESR